MRGGRSVAGGPEDRVRRDALVTHVHRVRLDARDHRVRPHLHAQLHEIARGAAGEILGERGQEARAAFHQDHTRVSGIDAPEVPPERTARDVGEHAGELHPGWPTAHDHERLPRLPRSEVIALLRLLEGEEKAVADLERIIDGLEPRRHGLPLIVAEVGVARAWREDEKVVWGLALVIRDHHAAHRVYTRHIGEQHRGVPVVAK